MKAITPKHANTLWQLWDFKSSFMETVLKVYEVHLIGVTFPAVSTDTRTLAKGKISVWWRESRWQPEVTCYVSRLTLVALFFSASEVMWQTERIVSDELLNQVYSKIKTAESIFIPNDCKAIKTSEEISISLGV